MILDMTAAASELGYRAVTTYVEAVARTCAWLVREMPRRDWGGTCLHRVFDYAAEDTALRSLG